MKFLNDSIFTSQIVVGAVFCISHEIWKPRLYEFLIIKSFSFPKRPFFTVWKTLTSLVMKLFASEIINSPQILWSWRQ